MHITTQIRLWMDICRKPSLKAHGVALTITLPSIIFRRFFCRSRRIQNNEHARFSSLTDASGSDGIPRSCRPKRNQLQSIADPIDCQAFSTTPPTQRTRKPSPPTTPIHSRRRNTTMNIGTIIFFRSIKTLRIDAGRQRDIRVCHLASDPAQLDAETVLDGSLPRTITQGARRSDRSMLRSSLIGRSFHVSSVDSAGCKITNMQFFRFKRMPAQVTILHDLTNQSVTWHSGLHRDGHAQGGA